MIKPGDPRGAHRRRPPSGLAVRVLRAADPGHPRRPAGDADQGVHRGRDRLLLAALEDRAGRGADPAEGRRGCTRCRGAARRSSPRRLQKLLHFTGKADADRWCEIHGIAHSLGIKTNATMLYGHVETMEERVDHLLRLRRAAGQVRGFHHVHSPVLPDRDHQAGAAPDPAHRRPADDRGLAAAPRQLPAHRGLLGDDRRGDRLARAALRRRPTSTAPSRTRRSPTWPRRPARRASPREQILRMVRDAGKIAVERDALYNVVKVWS